jgi:HEAT repeat protein
LPDLVLDKRRPLKLRARAADLLTFLATHKKLKRTLKVKAGRAFLQLFHESEPTLAWAVAPALPLLCPSPRASRLLLEVIKGRASSESRRAAVYALSIFKVSRADRELAKILSNRKELTSIRAEAAEALGTYCAGSKGAISALVQALGDRAPEVRLFSANALALCGNRRAIPALRDLLADRAVVKPYGSVAAEAAYAIRLIEQVSAFNAKRARSGHGQ